MDPCDGLSWTCEDNSGAACAVPTRPGALSAAGAPSRWPVEALHAAHTEKPTWPQAQTTVPLAIIKADQQCGTLIENYQIYNGNHYAIYQNWPVESTSGFNGGLKSVRVLAASCTLHIFHSLLSRPAVGDLTRLNR